MTKRIWCGVGAALLVAFGVCAPASAQVCAPLDNGRLANVYHEGTFLYFEPVVEFREMVLTISGPCEDIVKKFGPKDEISFDIREIERVTDGHYNWTLQRVASIDERLQQELQEARGSGKEDDLWWNAFQAGKIPDGPYTDSGAFTVERGAIIDPASGEEKRAAATKAGSRASGLAGAAVAGGVAGGEPTEGNGNTLATKDFVINDDLIVIGSTCVGFDCVNGEVFSFDTIRLKENNLRIKFEDTSGGSFPSRDWEIEVNSSANGGQSHFRINDVDGARSPFTIEAAAPSHSLYTDSSGRVGLGTSNPVLELHVVDGDTPAMRLEQDTSSGFGAQTWDIAGNETNFFVRDATNGSTLPFRIFPGSTSSSLVIRNSDVGVGTSSPSQALHVRRTDGSAQLLVEDTNGGVIEMVKLDASGGANGRPRLTFTNPNGSWFYEADGDNFEINRSGSGAPEELLLEPNGDLTIGGTLTELSSRSAKEGFVELDPSAVLASVLELPVLSWRYTADEQGARHVGPMAEDFHRAFGLGDDDKHIAPSDKVGVALLAIQGLQKELAVRDSRIEELSAQKAELERRMSELERLVGALQVE